MWVYLQSAAPSLSAGIIGGIGNLTTSIDSGAGEGGILSFQSMSKLEREVDDPLVEKAIALRIARRML